MTRFLSTTAILFALSGTAFADSHSAKNEDTDGDKTEIGAVKETEMSTETAETKEEVQSPTLTRPNMARDGYSEVEMADIQQLKSDEVEGSYVYGTNDETVGEIDALIMDTDGQVLEAVINVGGFLGIGEKPVKVAFDRIQVLKGEDGEDFRFYIESSEEKLEAMPEYEED